MKIVKKTMAFTLTELMIVVTLIMIVFWAWSQLDFNSIWAKEKLEIFNTKILSHYEEIRNNALLGKWIGSTLEIPDWWKITYSDSGSGNIATQYLIGSTWTNYSAITPLVPEKHSINTVQCLDLQWWNIVSWDAEIIFNGNQLTLSGSCNPTTHAKIQFETEHLDHTFNFEINTLNWIMEIQ
jgi:hypothetical protein